MLKGALANLAVGHQPKVGFGFEPTSSDAGCDRQLLVCS